MCEICASALNVWWPDTTEKERNALLWEATAFPFGCGYTIADQLAEASEVSKTVGEAISASYREMDHFWKVTRPLAKVREIWQEIQSNLLPAPLPFE